MLLYQFYIEDGNVRETSSFKANKGIEIYEVIRIIRGVPVFPDDHLKRLYHSAWLCHLEIPIDPDTVKCCLKTLIQINSVEEGNIRFSYCFRPAGRFQAYFIPHFYPGNEMLENGVDCGILQAERTDPNAKVVHAHLRDRADQLRTEGGFYEVLLLNNKNEFTEGSRSNLFFINRGVFITSPSEEVLPGITRQKVMQWLEDSGKKFEIRNLGIHELPDTEGAFLTGTSPKVLPVRRIGDVRFPCVLPQIREAMAACDRMIEENIRENFQQYRE